MATDWKGISSRIKGLIGMADRGRHSSAATRLRVDEQTLRRAIEEESPTAIRSVMAALVRVYGLDPSWMLTGKYDPTTHRTALAGDEAAIERLLSELLSPAPEFSTPHRNAAEVPLTPSA